MNLLDLMIVLTAGAAAYGGYRLGFLARIFSWAGLAVGALVADRFLPDVVGFFSSSDPQIRLIAAISFLVGAAMLGQGVGLAVGSLLHAALPLGAGLRQGDRIAGSALGVVGVMVAVWLLTPALAAVPGWPSESTRDSTIAHLVEDVAPAAPETMQALRRFVQDGTFPAVFNELRRSPDPGPPPDVGLDEAVHQRVVRST
ncbi:MAG TPA: CvpA family protein, partial [Acidimicrobiia bacterium]|nr:CvpA family protein [Acidimicrobiia bacterium]